MQIALSTTPAASYQGPCAVVAGDATPALLPAAADLDAATGGALAVLLAGGDFSGERGRSLLVRPPGPGVERVLLVGVGKTGTLDESGFLRVLNSAMQALTRTGASSATLYLTELEVSGRDSAWKVRAAASALRRHTYHPRPAKTGASEPRLATVELALPADLSPELGAEALAQGEAIGAGYNLARELGDLPANICTPSYLAERARALATEYSLEVDVLDTAQMRELGMGALLAVAQGSSEPPRLIVLHYRGAGDAAPVALVGKGVTFDSGGISIKPAAGMDEMKFDMCGAASVLGTLKAIAQLGLAVNVTGVIPASENLPSGTATKPGDVVRTLSGQTVEILNTDAEGRLLLADALTYCARFKPDVVIDIATLTGACVVALGRHATGLISTHPPLAQALLTAGRNAHDRAWELPLWDEYRDALKSNFADLPNVAGRDGGTITAAAFLANFTRDYRWAHLDIAGTAWNTGSEKGATGRPVGLLVHYLLERAAGLSGVIG